VTAASSEYLYVAEKFRSASHCLQLPHPEGEARSIAHALFESTLALHDLGERVVPGDPAREWIERLRELVDTSAVEDPSGLGVYFLKAQGFSVGEKYELRDTINELARWAEEKSRNEGE
jgi:hypothetical protein